MSTSRVELPDLALQQPQDENNKNNNNKLLVYLSRTKNGGDFNNKTVNFSEKYSTPVSLEQAFEIFTSDLETEYKEIDAKFAEKEANKTDEQKKKEQEELEAQKQKQQEQQETDAAKNNNNKKNRFNKKFQPKKEDSAFFQKYSRL